MEMPYESLNRATHRKVCELVECLCVQREQSPRYTRTEGIYEDRRRHTMRNRTLHDKPSQITYTQ
jgi:hypothetical protein